MCPPTPSSTPTDTPFPYTTLFRSVKRASQRDPLPLSARQTLSTGAEPCVIAMRQREDHIVRAGGNGRLRDQRRISIGFREARDVLRDPRSEEHTSELQSLMRISYAVFCLKKQKKHKTKSTVL